MLYQLSETEDNFEKSREFFFKISTTIRKYEEYFNSGLNAFNDKDYEMSIVLWRKALDLIPDHENTEVILNNIDIAKNKQKHN